MNSIGILISVAVILQSIEFFWISAWRWQTIASDFPRQLGWVLSSHKFLNLVRLLVAIAALIMPIPMVIGVLVFTTWAINLRWRGTFNGGSDFMTFHILLAWWVSVAIPGLGFACQLYISVQMILSYFVAGVSKIKNLDWRNGKALQVFLGRTGWVVTGQKALILSWILIFFEILSPLALLFPAPFVVLAILFHLGNVYVFGLNRFFFAWLAGYPALFLVGGLWR